MCVCVCLDIFILLNQFHSKTQPIWQQGWLDNHLPLMHKIGVTFVVKKMEITIVGSFLDHCKLYTNYHLFTTILPFMHQMQHQSYPVLNQIHINEKLYL